MKNISQLFKHADTDRKVTNVPTKAQRVLGTAELDKVAAGGGKAGSSANPVED